MAEPWYILESRRKDYLHNKTLYRRDYPCRAGEHEHCEFCWARFSALPEDLHGGYYEPQSESWLCPDCVEQFSDLFGWTVTEAEDDEE